jgi:predicted ArsR family transcriptional regulator
MHGMSHEGREYAREAETAPYAEQTNQLGPEHALSQADGVIRRPVRPPSEAIVEAASPSEAPLPQERTADVAKPTVEDRIDAMLRGEPVEVPLTPGQQVARRHPGANRAVLQELNGKLGKNERNDGKNLTMYGVAARSDSAVIPQAYDLAVHTQYSNREISEMLGVHETIVAQTLGRLANRGMREAELQGVSLETPLESIQGHMEGRNGTIGPIVEMVRSTAEERLTNEQIAALADTSHHTVRRFLNGQTLPVATTAKAIMEVVGVPESHLRRLLELYKAERTAVNMQARRTGRDAGRSQT